MKLDVSKLLVAAGVFLAVMTVAWWWLVFSEVVRAQTLSVTDALPCMARDSDLCSLAQALCKGTHFLGIKRYFVEAFWASSAVLILGFGVRFASPIRT